MAKARRKSNDEPPVDTEAESESETPLPQEEVVANQLKSQGIPSTQDPEIDSIVAGLMEAPNWSAKIRYLHDQGFKNSSIASIITELRGWQMRPQHVNNVIQHPLKSQGSRGPGRPKAQEDERTHKILRVLPKPIVAKN